MKKLTDEERKVNRTAAMKLWYSKNREKELIRTKKRRLEYPEEHNKLNKAFIARNPGYSTKLGVKRREKAAGRKRPENATFVRARTKLALITATRPANFVAGYAMDAI